MKYLLLFASVLLLIFSCRKDRVSFETTPYELEKPAHFSEMPIPADNPLTVEGIALGRNLFYDPQLSLDNSISCASCHDQQHAFTDPRQYSEGVDGALGNRNSMPLFNLGWQQFFFWDGRALTLEEQILQPVTNPVEMHESWDRVEAKLQASEYYRNEFFKAFGISNIKKEYVSKAIAQFLRTLISATSKYDVMYKIEHSLPLTAQDQLIKPQITTEEWAGYDLFKRLDGADCAHCHQGTLMQVQKYSNNGLDLAPVDFGRELVTGSISDRGKFKVPSLRNIALTAPYMHDGRFQTLDQVIEQYSSGVHISPTIDPLIEYASQGGVMLDADEKALLKTFLLTLTDYQFINDPRFSKPE